MFAVNTANPFAEFNGFRQKVGEPFFKSLGECISRGAKEVARKHQERTFRLSRACARTDRQMTI